MESVICSAEVADDHVAKFTSLLRARDQNLQSLVNGAVLVPQYSVLSIFIIHIDLNSSSPLLAQPIFSVDDPSSLNGSI